MVKEIDNLTSSQLYKVLPRLFTHAPPNEQIVECRVLYRFIEAAMDAILFVSAHAVTVFGSQSGSHTFRFKVALKELPHGFQFPGPELRFQDQE